MNAGKSPLSRRRGTAMAPAMVAIMILLAMGAGLMSLGVNGRIFSTRNAEKIKARSAADSGLASALVDLNNRLRTDPSEIEAVIDQTLPPGDVVLRITGDINLGNGGEVVVRPGSSLVLYTDWSISADNSVGFNNEAGNVRDFQMYATGTGEQVFNLKDKSSVFGTIYAPDVDITMYPGSDMYGAIVGKSVTFKSGSTFYYDEALRDNVSAYDQDVGFIIER